MRPLLLQRYPELTLPWTPLGSWPTPVRRVQAPGAPLWVKDEGRAGPVYGGNKVRKLEHLLGAARQAEAHHLITLGAVGSHHVLATAIYARRLDMLAHAVVFPQPDTPHVRTNARLIAAAAGRVEPAPNIAAVGCAWPRLWLALRAEGGRAPHRIPAGGSDALGTAGWVSAGLEVAEAVASGELERPERIYLALGSTGSVAGMLAGLRLAGLDSELVAVRVVDRVVSNAAKVRRLARATLGLLQRHGAALPEVKLDGLRVVHGWFCGAYGKADERVLQAVARARELGLQLEPTYTGKAFAACLAEREGFAGPVLFVNTVNTVPLDPLLAEAPAEVPEALRPLLK